MKGDFSRFTFDPANHFTRVLMQQGRVQLDADWNEQTEILWHYLRMLATDLIGPYGGPEDQLGFEIGPMLKSGSNNELENLSIGTGRYYVDGILCENEPVATGMSGGGTQIEMTEFAHHMGHKEEAVDEESEEEEEAKDFRMGTVGQKPSTYYTQSGYPIDSALGRERYKLPDAPFLVYLDVWERSVSASEQPSIREIALAGPDTAARSQVVWQVKVVRQGVPNDPDEIKCEEFEKSPLWMGLMEKLRPQGRGGLAAKAPEPEADDSTDPCIISPDARYRGAENQLYRVEIHTGSPNADNAPPTFKWSRDNGSNVYPVVNISEKIVYLEHLGRDERAGLQAGDWVELIDAEGVLFEGDMLLPKGTPLPPPPPLYKVDSVDTNAMSVTLKKAPPKQTGRDTRMLLRRWDQRAGDSRTGGLKLSDKDNAALITSDWVTLEDGIQVRFQAPSSNVNYRTGDYWLIPARTATGDIEWPRDEPNQPRVLPPRGVEHHYAPLACIYFGDFTDENGNQQTGFHAIDLRRVFLRLAMCFVPSSP